MFEFRLSKTNILLVMLCAITSHSFYTLQYSPRCPKRMSHFGPEPYPGVDGSESRLPYLMHLTYLLIEVKKMSAYMTLR
jgi:hypothetical protein